MPTIYHYVLQNVPECAYLKVWTPLPHRPCIILLMCHWTVFYMHIHTQRHSLNSYCICYHSQYTFYPFYAVKMSSWDNLYLRKHSWIMGNRVCPSATKCVGGGSSTSIRGGIYFYYLPWDSPFIVVFKMKASILEYTKEHTSIVVVAVSPFLLGYMYIISNKSNFIPFTDL